MTERKEKKMTKIESMTDDVMKEEIKEIVSVFMDLPKTDRAILLNTAVGFKTLRRIESEKTEKERGE